MSATETLLLQRVASGEAGAARACVERYGPLVWSLARKYSPSTAEAEDAVQDIFLDVWRSAGRFDPERSSEATFVAMIARRRLLDLRRRRVRRRDDEELDENRLEHGEPMNNRTEHNAEASLVSRAMAKLEETERDVLVLASYHGLTQQEIASQTGMPLGTVKTIARRALMRVRSLLDGGHTETVAKADADVQT